MKWISLFLDNGQTAGDCVLLCVGGLLGGGQPPRQLVDLCPLHLKNGQIFY